MSVEVHEMSDTISAHLEPSRAGLITTAELAYLVFIQCAVRFRCRDLSCDGHLHNAPPLKVAAAVASWPRHPSMPSNPYIN